MRIPTTRGPLRRLGLVAVLAAALGGLTATPALAHTQLVSSTPGKGASAAAVTEVKLVFSDEISNAKVIVKDAHGKAFQSGAAEHKGTTVTQKLTGALPAGSYTVAYRVVGADGHPVQADGLTFTATAAGGDGSTGEQPQAAPKGGVGAVDQTGAAATSNEQPLKIDQQQAAESDSGSGMVTWGLIGVGVLLGVGIGVAIVYRAKRKHGAAAASE
ncbi:copper resistance protein CopC [Actinomadura nitritigenes]|jgi:methionine-rich copper-binding protein CopC|uniref:Copper resistance protein CopC n=1 Tax=Actinomadura nitritigenes TaxID=134602 RepID=A0ABS3R7X8_9ACTN|nr:copper resistance protein CopC [Actinomadura nitritigenes]MBO2442346.1 copper resistance protein CopC [Actinomadura nitritigenes]